MASDIESVLSPWIEAKTGAFTCAETPADLQSRLPVIRVKRGGGADGRFSGRPTIDVDVFASDADLARALAAQLHEALIFLRGTVGDAVVRDVRCDIGFASRPWEDEEISRRGAQYTVSLRAA
jgi:hypothetical protein